MDIFLNKLIQFYSNNATNLHHLTTHNTTCWPTKWRSHCNHRYVSSLHPMYTCRSFPLFFCVINFRFVWSRLKFSGWRLQWAIDCPPGCLLKAFADCSALSTSIFDLITRRRASFFHRNRHCSLQL